MPSIRRQSLAVSAQRRQDVLGSLTLDAPEAGTNIAKMTPSVAIGLREFLQKVERFGALGLEQRRMYRLNALLAVNLVPRHLQDGLPGEFRDGSAIALNQRYRRIAARRSLVPGLITCKNDAGSHPFDVPFPRAGDGLVKIVQVEHQLTVRRGKRSEILDMRVPAKLHG